MEKKTPLHWSADKGHTSICSELLNHGAEINALDKDKKTPLHWSAEKGNISICSELLNNGADVNARDKDDLTPLDISELRGHTEVVLYFHRMNEEGLWAAVKIDDDAKSSDAVKQVFAVAPGTNVNCIDGEYQRTPLHYSAKRGNTET